MGRAKDAALKNDSIDLSILTCSPTDQIYRLYGHSAIRYKNYTKHVDVVYNYGVFDFNAPHFMWRFIQGKTDYRLGRESYKRFKMAYRYYNAQIKEQILNYTYEQKQMMIALLEENYRPENRYYRYNFLFDNCATRIRDKVEEALEGNLSYTFDSNEKTFRDLVRECTQKSPWAALGPDYALGSKADLKISKREEMFLPIYLFNAFKNARIETEEGIQPLVKKERIVLRKHGKSFQTSVLITPFRASLLLLFFLGIVTWIEHRKKTYFWGIDTLVFGFSGIAGVLLSVLIFLSEHPTVNPNYLFILFHPFHLIYLPWLVLRGRKRKKQYYYSINAVVLTLFMLLWGLIPQSFNITVVPLVLCLLIRSISYCFLYRKK
jgi:hypothetical protein